MKNDGEETAYELYDSIIEEAVSFIQEKVSENSYKTAVEIGNYVLKKFFHDDFEYAKSHNPNKSCSFRKLCKHPDMPLSITKLFYMLKIAQQEIFLKKQGVNSDDLTYTHMLNLSKLPNGTIKLTIIKEIIDNHLSSRESVLLIKKYTFTNTPIILRDFDENKYKPWLYKPTESIEKLRILFGKQTIGKIPFSKTKLDALTPNKSKEILEIVNETINHIDSTRRCYIEIKKYLEKKDMELE